MSSFVNNFQNNIIPFKYPITQDYNLKTEMEIPIYKLSDEYIENLINNNNNIINNLNDLKKENFHNSIPIPINYYNIDFLKMEDDNDEFSYINSALYDVETADSHSFLYESFNSSKYLKEGKISNINYRPGTTGDIDSHTGTIDSYTGGYKPDSIWSNDGGITGGDLDYGMDYDNTTQDWDTMPITQSDQQTAAPTDTWPTDGEVNIQEPTHGGQEITISEQITGTDDPSQAIQVDINRPGVSSPDTLGPPFENVNNGDVDNQISITLETDSQNVDNSLGNPSDNDMTNVDNQISTKPEPETGSQNVENPSDIDGGNVEKGKIDKVNIWCQENPKACQKIKRTAGVVTLGGIALFISAQGDKIRECKKQDEIMKQRNKEANVFICDINCGQSSDKEISNYEDYEDCDKKTVEIYTNKNSVKNPKNKDKEKLLIVDKKTGDAIGIKGSGECGVGCNKVYALNRQCITEQAKNKNRYGVDSEIYKQLNKYGIYPGDPWDITNIGDGSRKSDVLIEKYMKPECWEYVADAITSIDDNGKITEILQELNDEECLTEICQQFTNDILIGAIEIGKEDLIKNIINFIKENSQIIIILIVVGIILNSMVSGGGTRAQPQPLGPRPQYPQYPQYPQPQYPQYPQPQYPQYPQPQYPQ